MRVLSLFDGLAGARLSLDGAGINVNKYYASEIDKYAIGVANRNYPDIIQVGNVLEISGAHYKNIDLLIGGSPCQDLSCLKAGKGLAGNKSRLMLEYARILSELKPDWFLLENVVPRKPEWKRDIDDLMGTAGVRINSDLFVQQNRPRVYWTNIPIDGLPARPEWEGAFYQYRRTYFRKNKSGVCPCLTANMGTGGHNVPLHSESLQDKLTPEECEKLQGIPIGYTDEVSNSQRYKMIGNSFTIPVIVHILKGMT